MHAFLGDECGGRASEGELELLFELGLAHAGTAGERVAGKVGVKVVSHKTNDVAYGLRVFHLFRSVPLRKVGFRARWQRSPLRSRADNN